MESTAKRKYKGKAWKSKRKRKLSQSDDEGAACFSSKYAEPPVSKIYNSRLRHSGPAELFRKDLISAMKLPDNEPLDSDDYILIGDSWKPEWEKGVQVPVDPDSLPAPSVREKRKRKKHSHFKLPKKFIRTMKDAFFSPEVHVLNFTSVHAEQVCRYDMDDSDSDFLNMLNEDREDNGLQPIEEHIMEKIIDEIETVWLENFQEAIRSETITGADADDDAICDVCRSPDSEEGNEIVFCDACNMCVHQSCYGIVKIPVGSWICRTCALNVRPHCLFCPGRGGAMKPTSSGEDWCHVTCAIWMPEVSFQHVEKMEPITKVDLVPEKRWALNCSLCNEHVGACIQCSFKQCNVAYHVTCAVKEGLKMRAIVRDDDDALKLKSFCRRHSNENAVTMSESDSEEGNKNELNFNDEVAYNIREEKIHEKEANFFNYVSADEISEILQFDKDIIEPIFNYWKLKRRANFNHPILPPREPSNVDASKGSYLYILAERIITLRKDLERARNLCYMVGKREKLTKNWIATKKEIFLKQVELLQSVSIKLSKEEHKLVLRANHGDLVYDKINTGPKGPTPNTIKVLNGLIGEENAKVQLNGVLKMSKKQETNQSRKSLPNPYKKHYLNGLLKRSQRWLTTVVQNKQESMFNRADSKLQSDHRNEFTIASSTDHGSVENSNSNSQAVDIPIVTNAISLVTPSQELEESSDQNEVHSECDPVSTNSSKDHYETLEMTETTESAASFEPKMSVVKTLVFKLEEEASNSGEIKPENIDVVSHFKKIKSDKIDEVNHFEEINSIKINKLNHFKQIKTENIDEVNQFRKIKLENSDEFREIRSENDEEGKEFLSIELVRTCESENFMPIQCENIDTVNNFESTKIILPNVIKKQKKKIIKSHSDYKEMSPDEEMSSLKTRESYLRKFEKKKRKSKKQFFAPTAVNMDSSNSETASNNFCVKTYNSDEQNFALEEETCLIESDPDSCTLVSNLLRVKAENEACHKFEIPKENVPIKNKLNWNASFNFPKVKVVLHQLEISDTDTNDSVLQKDMQLSLEKQNMHEDSEDTSSVKTVISIHDTCDRLDFPPVKNEVTSVISSCRNELLNTSSMQKSKDLTNNKRNKLVERIMKESKEHGRSKDITFPSVTVPRKGSLTGYKIPKKIKPDAVQNSLEHKRGNSPLSPLTDRTLSSTAISSSSYSGGGNKSWPKSSWKAARSQNGVPTESPEMGWKTGRPQNGVPTESPEIGWKTGRPQNGVPTESPEIGWKTGRPQKGISPKSSEIGWKTGRPQKTISSEPPISPVAKPKPLVIGEIESHRVVNRNDLPPRSGWGQMTNFCNLPRSNNAMLRWAQHDFPRMPHSYHNNHFLRGPRNMRPWLPGRGLYHQNMPRMPFRSAPNI